MVLTLLYLYVARNFSTIANLESPEPLANLYSRPYFRATWITTALDAGFWTAMRIKSKWLRDLCSVIFSTYYLFCAQQADEKVRKVRSCLTVEHLRVSWNKSTTPYLDFGTWLTRPRLMRYKPRAIRIPRPQSSAYNEPVRGWLYFNGPLSALKTQTKVILNIPGGGFVSMSPRNHEESLTGWAGKTGLPVLSLDYEKAPEYPYPYALNECFDVYRMIVYSQGRCLGLSGDTKPSIVLSGDSAGGNLATGLTLMILQSGSTDARRWHGELPLQVPDGLVLMYPALDVNIGNWMTDEQMSLIRDRGMRKTNRRVLSRKNSMYHMLNPSTPVPSDDGEDDAEEPEDPSRLTLTRRRSKDSPPTPVPEPAGAAGNILQTRIAVPSLISYVNDRILTPEMLRAMIILYVGPHNRPNFATEYLLSPVLAPSALLARFPKTYFLTGERDPLVDDTVIMAGRIRRAKLEEFHEREDKDLLTIEEKRYGYRDKDWVEVNLIEGASHGFMQFAGVFPEAWEFIYRIGRWYEDAFTSAERRKRHEELTRMRQNERQSQQRKMNESGRRHVRSDTGSSAVSDDEMPLEMSMTSSVSEKLKRAASPPGQVNGLGHQSIDSAIDVQYDGDPTTPLTPEDFVGRSRRESHDGGLKPMTLPSEDDLLGRRMKGIVGGLSRSDQQS